MSFSKFLYWWDSHLASHSKPSDLKTCAEPRETEKCPSVPSRRISLLQISTPVPVQPFTNHDSQLKFEIMLPFSPCSSCVWLFVDISCPGNPILTDINPEWSCFSAASPGCIRQLWWFVNFCDLYLFYVSCILWGWNQLLKESRVSQKGSTRLFLFCFGFSCFLFERLFLFFVFVFNLLMSVLCGSSYSDKQEIL